MLELMNSKQRMYTVSPLSEFDWCCHCLTNPTSKVDVRLRGAGHFCDLYTPTCLSP